MINVKISRGAPEHTVELEEPPAPRRARLQITIKSCWGEGTQLT